jgi:3-dehydroquinate synthetase
MSEIEENEEDFVEEIVGNYVNEKLESTIEEFKDILTYMKKLKNVYYSNQKIIEVEEKLNKLEEIVFKMDEGEKEKKWKIVNKLYEILYKHLAKRTIQDSVGLDLKYLILMADIYDFDLENLKKELGQLIKEIS